MEIVNLRSNLGAFTRIFPEFSLILRKLTYGKIEKTQTKRENTTSKKKIL